MLDIKKIILFILLFSSSKYQELIESNENELPRKFIFNELKNFDKKINKQNKFSLSFNYQHIFNTGHPNIDNNAEFYSISKRSQLISSRILFQNKWFFVEVSPYLISNSNLFKKNTGSGTLWINNNHAVGVPKTKNKMGFKQSKIIIHFKGLGVAYGNMSHWWSPGFHSSIVLSSNAPSQKTFSIGSFKEIRLNKISFYGNIILMPYENNTNNNIYFSGFKGYMKLHTKNALTTLGLHRTYLSGDFKNLSNETNFSGKWSSIDAVQLLFEPLFGQSKKGLDYTLINSPGFDTWDEILSGYINIEFPKDNFSIYANLVSDDNRANFIDLKAHWDHTLAYIIGFKKFMSFRNFSFFHGFEYVSTKTSNTFNPKFYRGNPNSINYYTNEEFDYFTYEGRRMGAHSGSSGDDLIAIMGFARSNLALIASLNYERHGIKSEEFPEIKSEIALTIQNEISDNTTFFICIENEVINNYGFINGKRSSSALLWTGLSFKF